MIALIGHSQEFSTNFIFKDAVGHTDTLILGYSLSATDSLDTIIGEKNLTESQIDTNFFVYASDVRVYRDSDFLKPGFRTKKQIVHLNNPDYLRYACIDVICKNFPLTIKWNKQEFQDTSRSKSFVIITPPGGWFDVGESPHLLSKTDSFAYTLERLRDYGRFYIDFIHSKPLKIWKLYIGFANYKNGLSIYNCTASLIKVYPNPCKNLFIVQFDNAKEVIFQLFDASGKLYFNEQFIGTIEHINISNLPDNLYYLKVISANGPFYYKILKISKL